MQHSSELRLSASTAATGSELLVLGYQGTLIPDFASSPATAAALCCREFPLEAWLEGALRDLDRRISDNPDGGGEPIDYGTLIAALRERLTGMLTQLMIARPDSTEERIAQECPALLALLKTAITEWVDAVAIFHRRFRKDAFRLAKWLGYSRLPELESLTPGSSDQHAGAHTVIRLLFRDGCCIYYKPRPVTGEWLWHHLVQAVNAHASPQLASPRALPGTNGMYGWVTALQPLQHLHDCENSSTGYWQAAGATLCLAEHVRMTDLHVANVLATSSGPALFDAESLGSPPAASAIAARHRVGPACASAIDDLLNTGLLPSQNSAALPDTSGLFGKSAPVPQIVIPCWSTCPDGRRRLEMIPAALRDHGNAPLHVSPLKVLPQMVSGYREAAAALMRCRDSLVSPGSAWRWTLEHRHAPRIILRDTLSYGILLSRSLHFNSFQYSRLRWIALRGALRDAEDRMLPKAILREEARALLQLRIPRFVALPASRTLAANSGRPLAHRFLSCSPVEAVLRKLENLTPNQLSEVQIPTLLLAVFGRHS